MQSYPPAIWAEALVWSILPIGLAAMFLVLAGYAAATIRLNASRRCCLLQGSRGPQDTLARHCSHRWHWAIQRCGSRHCVNVWPVPNADPGQLHVWPTARPSQAQQSHMTSPDLSPWL